jgi:hypothetical protein
MVCLQRVLKLGKTSILPIAELRNNGLSKGKASIEQTSQESHKARAFVSGAESEQYSTYGAGCAPKRHGRLHACPIVPTPEFPRGPHSLDPVFQSCENQQLHTKPWTKRVRICFSPWSKCWIPSMQACLLSVAQRMCRCIPCGQFCQRWFPIRHNCSIVREETAMPATRSHCKEHNIQIRNQFSLREKKHLRNIMFHCKTFLLIWNP